ncbi:lipoprotein [Rhizobium arsenicireducens]
MEKILVALLVTAALAGCSQTTRPANEKQAACAYARLSPEECAKSKYGYRGTTQPSIVSPSI